MTAGCVTLNEQKREVIIENLIISHPEVYDFLSDKKDPEAWIQKGLIIGCIGLKQMVVVERIDYIEKEFQKFITETNTVFKRMDITNTDSPFFQMRELIIKYFSEENGQLKQMLNDYFGKEDGQIKQLIDQRFDLNNKESAFSKLIEKIKENSDLEETTIAELLDPNKTDSPVKLLKEEIFSQLKQLQDKDIKAIGDRIKELKESEIKEIRDLLIGESAIQDELEKGTQKGYDFEDLVYSELESLARDYEDTITHVGKTPGPFGKSGDILIDINGDEKKRIVIECKDSSVNSTKAVKDEISNAMKNRNAHFGIFLFSKNDNMPREYCPIKITNSYIVTCGDKENLNISYKLGRVLLSKAHDIKDEIEFQKISIELSKIEENIKNIKNMQSQVSSILNSGSYLRENLEKLSSNINISVDKIERYLGEKHEKKAVNIDETDLYEEPNKGDERKLKRTKKEMPSWMREK